MIKFEEAISIISQFKEPLGKEYISFNTCLGRVLAEDILSDMDMPPFDKSAMDGFACRSKDLLRHLTIVDTIAAGTTPKKVIGEGECARIMTGAPLPQGADCVIMVEHTEAVTEKMIRFTGSTTKPNICYLGEDIRSGDTVLSSGTLLKPQHIAIMASVGATQPTVYKQPRVAILPTGDELVEPDKKPSNAMIRNTNGHQLIAQLMEMQLNPTYYGIVADDEETTRQAITKALNNQDVVILTGGVSMGQLDFVPQMIVSCGVDIHFQTIAIQPGKPTLFGSTKDNKYVFGLPGNPVSSFFQFELLVKPLLYQLMGHNFSPSSIKMPIATDYTRKKSTCKTIIPVSIENGQLIPVTYHGSAHLHALGNTHGIIAVEPGINTIKKGTIIDVRLI
ncbi:MAG: molybdopterin molybdotransferase MoeA [Bacteroidales bacterium]|nr:molybdopterin molybdotransferase MoeA [Bacteroidales bacterium]